MKNKYVLSAVFFHKFLRMKQQALQYKCRMHAYYATIWDYFKRKKENVEKITINNIIAEDKNHLGNVWKGFRWKT